MAKKPKVSSVLYVPPDQRGESQPVNQIMEARKRMFSREPQLVDLGLHGLERSVAAFVGREQRRRYAEGYTRELEFRQRFFKELSKRKPSHEELQQSLERDWGVRR